jgi:hypothetical protein
MMLKAKPPRLDFHLDGAVIFFDFRYSLRENMSKSKNHFWGQGLRRTKMEKVMCYINKLLIFFY